MAFPTLTLPQSVQFTTAITAGLMAYAPAKFAADASTPMVDQAADILSSVPGYSFHSIVPQNDASGMPHFYYFEETFIKPFIGTSQYLRVVDVVAHMRKTADTVRTSMEGNIDSADVQIYSALRMLDHIPQNFFLAEAKPENVAQSILGRLSASDLALLYRLEMEQANGSFAKWNDMLSFAEELRSVANGNDPIGTYKFQRSLKSDRTEIRVQPTRNPTHDRGKAIMNLHWGFPNHAANILAGVAARYGTKLEDATYYAFFNNLAGALRLSVADKLEIGSNYESNELLLELLQDARARFRRSGDLLASDNLRARIVETPGWTSSRPRWR